jgi:ectoine hydroxylase-related dioxygenase (phytanoyl-CoA dioxygenase family)
LDETQRNELLKEFEPLNLDLESAEIVQWECKPGDAVAFHGWTLHGGSPSLVSKRRVVSFRYFGDDCVFAQRPWVPSPPFTGNLQVGQPMSNSQLFPTVVDHSEQQ